MAQAPHPQVDPITFEVIKHRLWQINDEQSIAIRTISSSPIVVEGNDFNVGLFSDDGQVVRIVAADEALMEVKSADVGALARAAYHLGNRHCPVEIGEGTLRFPADHVLAEMLLGMRLAVTSISAPFEPEAGAYAAGHHHHSSEAKHAGIIHDFAQQRRPSR